VLSSVRYSEFVAHGTHQGEFMGIAPTSNKVMVEAYRGRLQRLLETHTLRGCADRRVANMSMGDGEPIG
jgi:hypothetical protein